MIEIETLDLSDVDIEIKIRSGSTDMKRLDKLMRDIVSSSFLSLSEHIVKTEVENKTNVTNEKILCSMTVHFKSLS